MKQVYANSRTGRDISYFLNESVSGKQINLAAHFVFGVENRENLFFALFFVR